MIYSKFLSSRQPVWKGENIFYNRFSLEMNTKTWPWKWEKSLCSEPFCAEKNCGRKASSTENYLLGSGLDSPPEGQLQLTVEVETQLKVVVCFSWRQRRGVESIGSGISWCEFQSYSATSQLCDLKQFTWLLFASISPSNGFTGLFWGLNDLHANHETCFLDSEVLSEHLL